jgi:hypothetical protein
MGDQQGLLAHHFVYLLIVQESLQTSKGQEILSAHARIIVAAGGGAPDVMAKIASGSFTFFSLRYAKSGFVGPL